MPSRIAIFGAILTAALQLPLFDAVAGQWLTEREPNLGYAFSYPSGMFQEIPGDRQTVLPLFRIHDIGGEIPCGGLE
jgi:hypothetical protein